MRLTPQARIGANKKFHLSRLAPGMGRWEVSITNSSYRSSMDLPTLATILPGKETKVSLKFHATRVQFEIAPELRPAMGRWGLSLRTSGWRQSIQIMNPKGATALVGPGKYELYLLSLPGKALGSYEITASTTKISLTR